MKFVILMVVFTAASLLHAAPVLNWIDTPAAAPNIRFLLHDDGAANAKSTASFVAVQNATGDARAIKLWSELNQTSQPLDDLLPHRCFAYTRADLKTHQTWCKSVKGDLLIFVEGGPLTMPAGNLRDVQRAALEGSPK